MQTSGGGGHRPCYWLLSPLRTRNGLLDKHFYHQPEAQAEAVAGGARALASSK